MNGTDLISINKERDIGVLMSNSLKPSLQCTQAANRAFAILKQITRAFMYRDRKVFLHVQGQEGVPSCTGTGRCSFMYGDRKVFLLLYKQFVRCHLEFAIPAWSPWLVSRPGHPG